MSSPHSAEYRTVNLTLSLLWVIVCGAMLIFIGLNEDSISAISSHPLTFLLALPALYGIYVWRRESMIEALKNNAKPTSITAAESHNLPAIPLSILEGVSPVSQLIWLAQGLASVCLTLITIATLRPLLLAALFAIGLLLIELQMLMFYWASVMKRIAAPSSSLTPQPAATAERDSASSGTKELLQQPDLKTESSEITSTESHFLTTVPEDLMAEQVASQDDTYQTLMALREQIEEGATPSSDEHSTDSAARQTVRDFRNKAGYGTISGESLLAIPTQDNLIIVTLAFMPPFPASPELLADCEDDRVESVRVLQCQPLGAKIEIKFYTDAAKTDSTDVMLLWEAVLETP